MAKFIAQLAHLIRIGGFNWQRFQGGDYYKGIFIQTKRLGSPCSFSVSARLGIKGKPMRQIIRYEDGQLTLASTINL